MKTKRINFNIILMSIMFVLTCFCLCGCAEVNFVTYHNDDGTIQEYVYLSIDEQKLTKQGYNVESVKLEIQSNSYIEAKTLVDKYHNELYNQYRNEIISNDEYTALYNGIKIVEQKWENNEYIIGLQYNNSSIYQAYYNLLNNTNTSSSNTKQVEKLFYTKTYYYGTTNYGDYTIFNRIYNYYANTVFSQFSPEQTSLTYSYSVSTRRYHSDADHVNLDSNGNYIHTWNVSPSEPSRQIYFYTISANRSVWIIACIMISLTICAILCVIGTIQLIKNRNKIQKNNEYNDNDIENNFDNTVSQNLDTLLNQTPNKNNIDIEKE